ncbi:hypothetical protein [Bradyrhizobium sp. HKCCYLRH3061]|uniref:hypothetical protein n=1 Tax=Bradyrhizobium sp. HKCCYLRH3061 TaxID=3420734 RepID=UPI003EB79FD3
MRRLRLLPGAAGLALSLLGCATPTLPESYVVPDERWKGEFALSPEDGDVVHLVTFIKGDVVPETGGAQNNYPPFSEHVRLPLRYARTALTPDEANLLMGFLATGSEKNISTDVGSDLEANRVALWNALVRSLILTKSEEGSPARLNVAMDTFCPRFLAIAGGSLARSFFADVCRSDPRRNAAVAARPIAGRTPKNAAAASTEARPTRDLRQISALARPLDAVVAHQSTLDAAGYYMLGAAVVVSVADVERGGASMRNPQSTERLWSLADWQASGICPDKIVNIALRTEPMRLLRVVPAGRRARYRVQSTGPGRRHLIDDDPDAPFETMAADSLVFLSPSDVATVQWGTFPDLVTELSPRAQLACTP